MAINLDGVSKSPYLTLRETGFAAQVILQQQTALRGFNRHSNGSKKTSEASEYTAEQIHCKQC
jgi:hypothetical protein